MATYWENSCSFGLRYVSWYKYLIVSLVFSHLGFWTGNLFLIAPFPDLCLLVPFLCIFSILTETSKQFICLIISLSLLLFRVTIYGLPIIIMSQRFGFLTRSDTNQPIQKQNLMFLQNADCWFSGAAARL